MKILKTLRKQAYLLPLRLKRNWKFWHGQILVPTRNVEFANIGEGTHEDGQITLLPTAVVTSTSPFGGRYLLWKRTVNTLNCALCTTNDVPIGISDDFPDNASYLTQGLAIKLLGVFHGTLRVQTDGTITDGAMCKAGTNGQATLATTGTDSATNTTIGRAIISPDGTANAGDVIELVHSFPSKLTF